MPASARAGGPVSALRRAPGRDRSELGSSLASALPCPSTATHSPEAAQETAVSRSLSIGVRLQVAAGAVGSALASTSPALSSARAHACWPSRRRRPVVRRRPSADATRRRRRLDWRSRARHRRHRPQRKAFREAQDRLPRRCPASMLASIPATASRGGAGQHISFFVDGNAQRCACTRHTGQRAGAVDRNRRRPRRCARLAAHQRVSASVDGDARTVGHTGNRAQGLAFVCGRKTPSRMLCGRIGAAEDVPMLVDGDAKRFRGARDRARSVAGVKYRGRRPAERGDGRGTRRHERSAHYRCRQQRHQHESERASGADRPASSAHGSFASCRSLASCLSHRVVHKCSVDASRPSAG